MQAQKHRNLYFLRGGSQRGLHFKVWRDHEASAFSREDKEMCLLTCRVATLTPTNISLGVINNALKKVPCYGYEEWILGHANISMSRSAYRNVPEPYRILQAFSSIQPSQRVTKFATPKDYIKEGCMVPSRHTRLEHTAQHVQPDTGYMTTVRFLTQARFLLSH